MAIDLTTAENIKKIRKALCLSQAEISRELNVTRSTISCYERGVRRPSYATIRKIIALAKKNNLTIELEDIRPE